RLWKKVRTRCWIRIPTCALTLMPQIIFKRWRRCPNVMLPHLSCSSGPTLETLNGMKPRISYAGFAAFCIVATRSFIINELERINRELNANFDLWAFGLRSVYNESLGRVEVYLESLRDQSVTIRGLNLTISLQVGERIHVENAYKFDPEDLRKLGAQTGFSLERTWLDQQGKFSSNLFRVD